MRKIAIGLIGFGKTGRLVATEIIKDPECVLRWVVRESARGSRKYASRVLGFRGNAGKIFPLEKAIKKGFLRQNRVDVIIDFSSASALPQYARLAAAEGIRIVSAVSKYGEEELALLHQISRRTSVLHSPNITTGINIVTVMALVLRKLFPDADVEIIEEHFRDKREVSGTALRIASLLEIDPQKQVNSVRVGGIIGNHEIIFGMRNQTLRVRHESVTRSAFGRGAIYAAKWVARSPKGFYTMEEVIRDKFLKLLRELAT